MKAVLSQISRFAAEGAHRERTQRALAGLGESFERYFGLGGN